jgi:hypothetical protein
MTNQYEYTTYGTTMSLEDRVIDQMGNTYTSHLAQAMGTTKEAIMASLLRNAISESPERHWIEEVDFE